MFDHFYSRYGLAITMLGNQIDSFDDVTQEMLVAQLENGQNHFRLEPLIMDINNGNVKFRYLSCDFFVQKPSFIGSQGKVTKRLEEKKSVKFSYFLSPTIITSNEGSGKAWNAANKIIEVLKRDNLKKRAEAKMTLMPMVSKFNNGNISQGYPKSSLLEVACSAITTFTPTKPAMLIGDAQPSCILPDLDIEDLKKFIFLFREMSRFQTSELMVGRARETKKKNETVITCQRPKLCNGNFPYAPQQRLLGSVALLAAIGRWAKEAGLSKEGEAVLDSLVDRPLYIVSYGKARSVTYGHWIVDLAKKDFLCDIVNSIQQVGILSEEKRDYNSTKYQTYLMFAERFLQLFDFQSLQDLLSIRAEYPRELEKLFNTYFINIMKKDVAIIQSARALGQWLNQTAYFAAKKEAEARQKTDAETKRKLKAKFLAEMESSAFSAKSHDSLLAQVVTRAGRLSFSDAPSEAIAFVDEVASGRMNLGEAKNLIVVYSRLRSGATKKATLEDVNEILNEESGEDNTINYELDESE